MLAEPEQRSFASLSQTPAWEAPVQAVAFEAKTSPGQVVLAPVQSSATSHCPAEARQTVAFEAKTSAGQVALEPVQSSATSHDPAEARQTVAEDSNWHVDEQQSPFVRLLSSHCSPASVVPLPHTV